MTRPLQEQIENLWAAQSAVVEVQGLLPDGVEANVRVDAELPQVEVQLLRCTHDQAVAVAVDLGLMRDGEGNYRDVRRSRFSGPDIIHMWPGSVADFPLLLTRVERGAARVPAGGRPDPDGPGWVEAPAPDGPPPVETPAQAEARARADRTLREVGRARRRAAGGGS